MRFDALLIFYSRENDMRRRMMENRVNGVTKQRSRLISNVISARNSFDLFVYVVGYEMIFN